MNKYWIMPIRVTRCQKVIKPFYMSAHDISDVRERLNDYSNNHCLNGYQYKITFVRGIG